MEKEREVVIEKGGKKERVVRCVRGKVKKGKQSVVSEKRKWGEGKEKK